MGWEGWVTMAWDGMGWDGMEWVEMGWVEGDGMGCVIGFLTYIHVFKLNYARC